MTHIDYGRTKDLELLTREYAKAKYRHDREDIEKALKRIMHTSLPITMLREDLLRATRANDRSSVKRIIMHIQKVRQDETYGKEIS